MLSFKAQPQPPSVIGPDVSVCNVLFSKVADHPKLRVFLFMFEQLCHRIAEVHQHIAVRWGRKKRGHTITDTHTEPNVTLTAACRFY